MTDVQKYLAKHGFPADPKPIIDFLQQNLVGGKIEMSVFPEDFNKPGKQMLGRRWTVRNKESQALSVVISLDGRVLERSYHDNGDVRISVAQAMLRGWFGVFPKRKNVGREKLDSTKWILQQRFLREMDYEEIYSGWLKRRTEESEDPGVLNDPRDVFRHLFVVPKKKYRKRKE
jgi:hypothetical protein